jgi:hypothetical protein
MAGAIKAIIATQFDATGIKRASKEFNKLGGTLRSTLGAVGLTVGLAAITNGLKEATKAAVMDAKSQGLLAQQLRNTTNATDSVIASNEAFINSLQRTTSIADDDLRPAMSALVRATGDVDKAQSLLALSTDIAAGTGRDLSSVAIAVGRAANGQTTALRRLGIVVKAGEDPIKALTAAFAGNAEAAANLDPFQRLNVIFGEIQEQIGFALLPTLQNFAAWFASPEGSAQVQKFVDLLVDAVTGLANFAKFISDNIALLGPLAVAIGIAATAMGIFNAIVLANPYVAAAAGLGILLTALVAVGGEAYKAKVEFERLNGAQTRFGGGILDRQKAAEKAAKNAMPQIIASNYGIGAGGAVIGATDKTKAAVKVDPIFQPPKGGASAVKKTTLQIAAEKAAEALAKAKAALKEFQDGIKELSSGFTPLTQASSALGEFQQTVVDTFDSINKKIAEGVANRTIGTKGLDNLKAFLKAQQNLLEENGRQRDAIIEKRSLAKALFDEVKDALSGTGNLASLLETQTRQVTTSLSRIIDGFTVTTKQTVEEVVGGQGVVSKLQQVVAKTKAFAVQLNSLKALGLDKDLFKQIVDAGPDVGGQLAKEILDGGTDSVKALNTTFKELQEVTAGVAEQTAVVMFNAGQEVAGGLVAGLLSQEAALVAAAKTLTDAFNKEFQAKINALQLPTAGGAGADEVVTYSLADIKLMQTAAGSPALAKSNAALANQLIARQAFTARGTTVSVVVNAGAGANGKTIGQQIQAELNKYAKSSAK